jgi:hypothetical protein
LVRKTNDREECADGGVCLRKAEFTEITDYML